MGRDLHWWNGGRSGWSLIGRENGRVVVTFPLTSRLVVLVEDEVVVCGTSGGRAVWYAGHGGFSSGSTDASESFKTLRNLGTGGSEFHQ